MATFKTVIVDAEVDISQRLADWSLDRQQFASIAQTAHEREIDASPLMPLNAPGTLAYIYGVETLRHELLNDEWEIARVNGVEVVINRTLGIRIGYHNVDRACDPLFPPRPRSAKGKVAERMSGATLWEFYGMEPGPLPKVQEDGITTYYVMVGEDGSVELSNPVIENGGYIHFHERIFIHRPVDDEWEENIDPETGPIDDFDITVTLKKNM